MNPLKAVRKALRRQGIRNHIRREQEEFLRDHPELRLPNGPQSPATRSGTNTPPEKADTE